MSFQIYRKDENTKDEIVQLKKFDKKLKNSEADNDGNTKNESNNLKNKNNNLKNENKNVEKEVLIKDEKDKLNNS